MSKSSSLNFGSSPFLDAKAEQINLVLSEPDVDLWKLRELALSEGGLVNGMCSRMNTARLTLQPRLLSIHLRTDISRDLSLSLNRYTSEASMAQVGGFARFVWGGGRRR
jgi:hypothetical protein